MIEIRAIEERDHRRILEIAEALPEWFDADARGRSIPADIRHQHGFVALSDEKVVGFITLFFAEGRLNIGWLGVMPGCQRKGIGTRLIGCAGDFAKQHGITELATYTLGDSVDYKPYESTRAFYFKQGFTIYQRNKTDNPGCPEEIRIIKHIA